MLASLKEYAVDLFDIFYPNLCASCHQKLFKGENTICLRCEADLPATDHWQNADNDLIKRFWGRINLCGAATLYQFHKATGVQQLLHQLKYKGREDIGEFLGKRAGYKILEAGSVISPPAIIVPVPLHWKKQKVRGYNQSESFARGMAQVLGVPVSTNSIERTHENISQTKKKRYDRWDNVAEIFAVKDEKPLKGQHILLVDDVVTTGATAEACMKTILSVPNTSVSFVAIAMASH